MSDRIFYHTPKQSNYKLKDYLSDKGLSLEEYRMKLQWELSKSTTMVAYHCGKLYFGELRHAFQAFNISDPQFRIYQVKINSPHLENCAFYILDPLNIRNPDIFKKLPPLYKYLRKANISLTYYLNRITKGQSYVINDSDGTEEVLTKQDVLGISSLELKHRWCCINKTTYQTTTSEYFSSPHFPLLPLTLVFANLNPVDIYPSQSIPKGISDSIKEQQKKEENVIQISKVDQMISQHFHDFIEKNTKSLNNIFMDAQKQIDTLKTEKEELQKELKTLQNLMFEANKQIASQEEEIGKKNIELAKQQAAPTEQEIKQMTQTNYFANYLESVKLTVDQYKDWLTKQDGRMVYRLSMPSDLLTIKKVLIDKIYCVIGGVPYFFRPSKTLMTLPNGSNAEYFPIPSKEELENIKAAPVQEIIENPEKTKELTFFEKYLQEKGITIEEYATWLR